MINPPEDLPRRKQPVSDAPSPLTPIPASSSWTPRPRQPKPIVLSFPAKFPDAFSDPVVAAASNAELTVRQLDRTGSPSKAQRRQATLEYMLRAVLAFTSQARAAAQAGSVPLTEVPELVRDFTTRASNAAYTGFDLLDVWPDSRLLCDDFEGILVQSDQWLSHLEAVNRLALTKSASTAVVTDRRLLVDQFIAKVAKETGEKITRKQIWQTVYYDETEFERWQRREPETRYQDGGGVDQKIRRTLALLPADFLRSSRNRAKRK